MPPSERSDADALYEARVEKIYEMLPTGGGTMACTIAEKLDASVSEVAAKLKLLKRRERATYQFGMWSRS